MPSGTSRGGCRLYAAVESKGLTEAVRIVARVTREWQVSAGGVYDLGYHVAGCPKYRCRVLAGWVPDRCEGLIRTKADEHGWRIVAPEIMPSHVYLLVKAHRSGSPSPIASQFKDLTSQRLQAGFLRLRCQLPGLRSCPYLAATVGPVCVETLCRYCGTENGRSW